MKVNVTALALPRTALLALVGPLSAQVSDAPRAQGTLPPLRVRQGGLDLRFAGDAKWPGLDRRRRFPFARPSNELWHWSDSYVRNRQPHHSPAFQLPLPGAQRAHCWDPSSGCFTTSVSLPAHHPILCRRIRQTGSGWAIPSWSIDSCCSNGRDNSSATP
jgi:hypothetical protein